MKKIFPKKKNNLFPFCYEFLIFSVTKIAVFFFKQKLSLNYYVFPFLDFFSFFLLEKLLLQIDFFFQAEKYIYFVC